LVVSEAGTRNTLLLLAVQLDHGRQQISLPVSSTNSQAEIPGRLYPDGPSGHKDRLDHMGHMLAAVPVALVVLRVLDDRRGRVDHRYVDYGRHRESEVSPNASQKRRYAGRSR